MIAFSRLLEVCKAIQRRTLYKISGTELRCKSLVEKVATSIENFQTPVFMSFDESGVSIGRYQKERGMTRTKYAWLEY